MADTTRDNRIFRSLIWATAGVVVVSFLGRDLIFGTDAAHLDLAVYLSALVEWRSGGSLYDAGIDIGDAVLPFTYPPFAAVVLVPLTLAPLAIAQALWTLCTLALAALVVRQVVAPLLAAQFDKGWHRDAWLVGSWLMLVFSGPVAETIQLGQISLLVWTLVIVDLTLIPPRYRGVLTGLAGGIKLVPLFFLGYFALTRQWRAAALAVAGFLGATLVGFAVLPRDSLRYWTTEVLNTSRVGSLASQHNKSLLGLLEHWGWSGPDHIVWVVLVALIVVIGFWQALRSYRSGARIAPILVVGLLAGIAAPITWMHHIPWLPLTAIYLLVVGRWWRWVGAAILVAYNYFSPAAIPLEGLPLWQQIAQGSLTVVLVALVCFGLPSMPTDRVSTSDGDQHRGGGEAAAQEVAGG